MTRPTSYFETHRIDDMRLDTSRSAAATDADTVYRAAPAGDISGMLLGTAGRGEFERPATPEVA